MHKINGRTVVDLDFNKKLKKDIVFDEIREGELYSQIVSEGNEVFALAYGKTIEECEWNANLIESAKDLVKGIEDACLMLIRLNSEKKKDLRGQMDYLEFELTELRNKAVSLKSKQKFIKDNKL